MSDRETTTHDEADESAEERRHRQSAREVGAWEAAFATAKDQGNPAWPADADRASADATLSRAHRAEKTSARSRNEAPPDDRAAGTPE
jgi:hypothetical protein